MSGSGLGSDIITSVMLVSPCYCYIVDPISMKNRIWGDGNGTGWCDANSSRLCPVRCWKPVVSYHAQI